MTNYGNHQVGMGVRSSPDLNGDSADRPAGEVTAENRAHLIDNDLESKAELDALVADYLAEAERLQTIPAAAIPFDIALADLATR